VAPLHQNHPNTDAFVAEWLPVDAGGRGLRSPDSKAAIAGGAAGQAHQDPLQLAIGAFFTRLHLDLRCLIAAGAGTKAHFRRGRSSDGHSRDSAAALLEANSTAASLP
jgi:hypothetical protein